jgi:P-type E1-E2 ATPase
MLNLSIPGYGELHLEHVVFDFNGTVAIDGTLIDGLDMHLRALAKHFTLHVVTGDSSGTAKVELANIPCELTILPAEDQGIAKAAYIERLNPEHVVAIGNGRNDQQMLKAARLGIAVVGQEGLANPALAAATIIVPTILSAIYLLRDNNRLLATLRS